MEIKKNVYIIIDGQAESCGKGKVIGQFALENDVGVSIKHLGTGFDSKEYKKRIR